MKYQIQINWGKIKIIINELDYTVQAIKKKLPGKYRGIEFARTGALLGQKINLHGNTNDAAKTRLNKAKGAWGIIKGRIFLDSEIKTKNKIDLWNAAIGSIMKYSLTTLRTTEYVDRKIQQFTSRCVDEIIYPRQNQENREYLGRPTNRANRTRYCIPTVHSQLQKERICDIYRWRTTLSPAYLNNRQEMETEMRIFEYNWYRMKKIMIKHHEQQNLTENEIQLMGDYQSMVHPERWKEIEIRIRTQNPPSNNTQYRKTQYQSFKELAKLVQRYQTYYPGKYMPKMMRYTFAQHVKDTVMENLN